MRTTQLPKDLRELRTRNPYSWKQQLRRVLWWIGCFLFFKFTLRPMYAWRRAVLRLFGAKLAAHVNINRTARIEFPWNLEMGRYSSIGEQVWIYNLGKVHAGEFVVISQRAFLCTGTHDYTKLERPQVTRPINIESGVWVAADAYVGPGVTIGRNSVIAARSVVVKDMPSEMVCGGHPCRPIKPKVMSDQSDMT